MRVYSRLALIPALLLVTSAAVAEEIEALLTWSTKAELSVPVSGVVAEIKVQAGDRVKKGDVLLVLDDTVFKAQAEYAQTNLKFEERRNKEAKQELERNQELYDRTLLSNHELEAAHIEYEKSLSAYSLALKTAAQAKYELKYSKISAPFDGIVVAQKAAVGQTVVSTQSAPTLMEFAATDTMAAEFVVTGSSLHKVNIGNNVNIVIGKSSVKGRIVEVAYEPFPKTDRYAVKASFAAKGNFYRIGRRVSVILP